MCTIEICVLNRDNACLSEYLLWEVVDQLSVDETGDAYGRVGSIIYRD